MFSTRASCGSASALGVHPSVVNGRRSSRRRRRGFSLIEIMIVIVIIGMLVGAVSLSSKHFLDKSKQTRARSDLATYKSAVATFYAEEGRYPSNDEGLALLAPKYIEKVRPDPWGHPYQYNFPGRSAAYEVVCFGADGHVGGDGVDADISTDDLDVQPLEGSKGVNAK